MIILLYSDHIYGWCVQTSVNLDEFSERPSKWSGLGALVLQGEVEITGFVQHEENTALKGPNMSYPTPTGR